MTNDTEYPESLCPLHIELEVISHMVFNEESCSKVMDNLCIHDFSNPTARRFFEIITEMFNAGTPVSLASMCDRYRVKFGDLTASQIFESVTEIGLAGSLLDHALDTCLISSERRRMWKLGSRIQEMAEKENIESLHEKVVDRAIAMSRYVDRKQITSAKELMETYDVEMERRAKEDCVTFEVGEIDRFLRGIRRQQYLVIAGRPSQGKTSLALNVCHSMSSRGHPTGIISLETERYTVLSWLIAMRGCIPITTIQSHTVPDSMTARFKSAKDKIATMPIAICDNFGMTIGMMRNEIRKMKAMYPSLFMVVLDHIQLMQGDTKSGRNNELGAVSRGIKSMIKEFDICIAVLSQFNRSIETSERSIPQLSDLRECGDIEQDADMILAFHFRDVGVKTRRLRVLKNKEGQAGVDFDLKFDGSCLKFE